MPKIMKTIQEIQAEARQLTVLGRAYREEYAAETGRGATITSPRVLAQLPEPAVMTGPANASTAESMPIQRRERYIDVVIDSEDVLYRLMERETPHPVSLWAENAPAAVLVTGSAFDVLNAGYGLAEEESLAERLTPYAERAENGDGDDFIDRETVAEVETILETKLLPVADRLRTKAEIVEFLEGRMESTELITRTVARQCARENRSEAIVARHELTLSIGEP